MASAEERFLEIVGLTKSFGEGEARQEVLRGVDFSVEKGERDGRTYTAVEQLDRTQRQKELARLAGGERVTEALLHSTGEMLDQAEQWKRDQN